MMRTPKCKTHQSHSNIKPIAKEYKMNLFTKTILAGAILTAVATPALAVDAITVYGKANVVIQQADENGEDAVIEINTNASRFGVKGGVEINESLNAIYKLEWEVNMTDQAHANSSDDQIKARNQYVGLEGGFGHLVVGRNDTMLKQSQGKVDQFNDLEGDIKYLFDGDNRLGETLTYKTPKFVGMQLGATLIAEENEKQKDEDWVACEDDGSNADKCEAMTNGVSIALAYGDYKLKKSPVFASIAMDSKVAGKDTIRATVYGKFVGVQLGGMYQQSEKLGGDSESGYMVNAAYKISDFKIKAQYQATDLTLGKKKDSGSAISAGVDYKLAKPTKVYAYYTTFSFDADGHEDDNYVGLGMEHKF